jgi:hypothetical protein
MTRRTTIIPPNASSYFQLPVQPFAREIICVCLEVTIASGDTFQPRIEIRDRSTNLLFVSQCLYEELGPNDVVVTFGPSFPLANSTSIAPIFMSIPIPQGFRLPPVGQLTVFTGLSSNSNVRQMALDTIDEDYYDFDAA